VQARGFPGASFEQVDVQPGAPLPIKGYVVLNGQRSSFGCTLDSAGQVATVFVDTAPR
jgi:hypothetical protein